MCAAAILALDLGTTTGWAFNPSPGVIVSGTWDLHPSKGETEGERYRKFIVALGYFYDCQYLRSDAWLQTATLEVVYEDVRRHLGTTAAHVYGGLLATLKVWCLEKDVFCSGVGVGQIKKFWTGKGNATKTEMILEARLRGFDPVDDNEADALALLHKRIVEGPIVEPKKPKRASASKAAKRGQRLVRRASGGLRPGNGRIPQGRRKHAAPHPNAHKARARGNGGSRNRALD